MYQVGRKQTNNYLWKWKLTVWIKVDNKGLSVKLKWLNQIERVVMNMNCICERDESFRYATSKAGRFFKRVQSLFWRKYPAQEIATLLSHPAPPQSYSLTHSRSPPASHCLNTTIKTSQQSRSHSLRFRLSHSFDILLYAIHISGVYNLRVEGRGWTVKQLYLKQDVCERVHVWIEFFINAIKIQVY